MKKLDMKFSNAINDNAAQMPRPFKLNPTLLIKVTSLEETQISQAALRTNKG